MKIGILTMQRIYNYGSWMQAYGLKKLLEEIEGTEVSFVDYRPGRPLNVSSAEYLLQKIKVNLIDFLTKYRPIARLVPNPEFWHVYRFRREYQRLLGITQQKQYCPSLDMLLIGSDEVFNCMQKNVRVGYSGDLFGQNSNAKRICTYAASFGNTTMEKLKFSGKDTEVASWLKQIRTVSVRDQNSYDLVKELTGTAPKMHMDPALMYDFRKELLQAVPADQSQPYIIVYAYSNRLEAGEIEQIRQYAAKRNLAVYAIGGRQSFADRMIYDSPLNILKIFQSAACVVTDTFHGTIFSVITQRPFITIVRTSAGGAYGNQEKLDDLLKKLGLTERSVQKLDAFEDRMNRSVDYEHVNETIARERVRTKNYLRSVVRENDDCVIS